MRWTIRRSIIRTCHRHLGVGSALLAIGLASCGGKPAGDSAVAASENVPGTRLTGAIRGDHFYPEFQRWRIVKVVPIEGARVPIDAGGIPAILRGQYVHLSAGYMTVPALNEPGDLLTVACFRQSEQGLEVQPVAAKSGMGQEPLMLRKSDGDRLLLELYGIFELTLERGEPSQDSGYQQRALDRHFNQRYVAELQGGATASCTLEKASLPPLKHGDLELYAPASGRRIVLRGADLDPETPSRSSGASHEWRRKLDPAEPGNRIAGCAGEVLMTRLMSVESEEDPFATEYRIIGSLFGQSADGEMCGSIRFLRRIDPTAVLELFGVAAPQGAQMSRQRPGIQLLSWVSDGVFRARIGQSEFELTVLDRPQILVNMVSAGLEESAIDEPRVVTPAPVRQPTERAVEPEPATKDEIHRWVDENGVVHYSDRPGGQ